MAKRATIIDVAQAAGVSKSTVSLVLQNSTLVREETRVQVREAMARIGYVYNRSAANLRSSNAGLIGVVINDLRNPFFTEFATSLQMALSERGYATVIANTDENPALQAQVVGAMIEHGVSAFVISPAYGDEEVTFDAIRRAGVPTLQVLRQADDDTGTFPFAAPQYAQGSRMATEHLFAMGCKNLAFVGGLEGRSVTRERLSGYLAVLEERRQETLILPGRASRALGRESLKALVTDHPHIDGAVCFNDLAALGMITGCTESGRQVGSEFKIVGFDDIEDASQVFPSLTTIRCDVATFAKNRAATVINWLENDTKPQPQTKTPVELIIRGSTQS